MARRTTDEERRSLERSAEKQKAGNLGNVLIKLGRLLQEHTLRELRARGFDGVRPSYAGCLPHIDLEGTRISTLASRLEMTHQGAGKLVRELEGLGYVERLEDPEDGRATIARMTPEGFEVMFAALAVLREVEDQLSQELGPQAIAVFRNHVEKAVALVDSPPEK